jgi:uncharacterized RDD family membrane protein YckC
MEQENKKNIYAGFFTRLLATLVDIIVVTLLLAMVSFVTGVKNFIFFISIWWLYHTFMVIKWRTTIGGKLFGFEILNSAQEALTFKMASFRFIVSITPLLLYLLFRGIQHNMALVPSPTIQQLPQLLFLLPPLVMLFTQKKQMIHDLLSRSIVVDISKTQHSEGKNSKFYFVQKILRGLGTVAFVIVFGYMAVYTGVFYKLGKASHDSYNTSFEQTYEVNDYNDSRIIFYRQELEKESQNFIEANEMYDIFEADVKKDLALNCIEYFLAEEHNNSDWIDMGSHFRINARNKYAKNDNTIEKAKKNEDHMGKNFYYYDNNEVNHIMDTIANKWKKDANGETCQKMLPVNDMYTMFIAQYIKNREKALSYDEQEYKHAKSTGVLDKSFYKKQIKQETEWLEILYEKFPNFLIEKKEQEAKLEKEYQAILEKQRNKQIAEQERQNNLYKRRLADGESPVFLAIEYKKDSELDTLIGSSIDLEKKNTNGSTPLLYALQVNNLKATKKLLDVGVNMNVMYGDELYSALSWVASNNNIAAAQLLLDHGVDINYQFKKSETALTMAAKGCRNFQMVELLLKHGANPNLIDIYNQSTISGLDRYCQNGKNEHYQEMMDLLKKYQ